MPNKGDEQEQVRASLGAVTARDPNIKVSAKVASNHGAILRKAFRAVAAAVREVAALDHAGAEDPLDMMRNLFRDQGMGERMWVGLV